MHLRYCHNHCFENKQSILFWKSLLYTFFNLFKSYFQSNKYVVQNSERSDLWNQRVNVSLLCWSSSQVDTTLIFEALGASGLLHACSRVTWCRTTDDSETTTTYTVSIVYTHRPVPNRIAPEQSSRSRSQSLALPSNGTNSWTPTPGPDAAAYQMQMEERNLKKVVSPKAPTPNWT